MANAALAVSGTVANQALDIKTVNASGTVTLNGARADLDLRGAVDLLQGVGPSRRRQAGLRLHLPDPVHGDRLGLDGRRLSRHLRRHRRQRRRLLQPARHRLRGQRRPRRDLDVSNQALNVLTYTVGGTVTLNGAAPTPTSFCTGDPTATQAIVTLRDATKGYTFDYLVPCSSTTLAWTGTVFPGNYEVTSAASRRTRHCRRPTSWPRTASPSPATAPTTRSTSRRPRSAAPSRSTPRPRRPTPPAPATRPHQGDGAVDQRQARLLVQLLVPCSSSTFTWSGQVFPATYDVSVYGAGLLQPADAAVQGDDRPDGVGQHREPGARRQDGVGRRLAHAQRRRPVDDDGVQPEPDGDQGERAVLRDHLGLFVPGAGGLLGGELRLDGRGLPRHLPHRVAGAGGYSNLPSEGFLVTPRLKVE